MTNKADRPFSEVAAAPENANWEKLIARPSALYNRADDVRSPLHEITQGYFIPQRIDG